jgi:hypothetical protein
MIRFAPPTALMLLLSRVPSLIQWRDSTTQRTALHAAAERGQTALTDALLTAGCSPHIADFQQYTPLLLAANGGHLACVERLLAAGADARATAVRGWTALHGAAWGGHALVVQRLLAAGALPNAPAAQLAATPLHIAAATGHHDCCASLLAAGGDPTIPCLIGYSPLYVARLMGQPDAHRLFLAHVAASGGSCGGGGGLTPLPAGQWAMSDAMGNPNPAVAAAAAPSEPAASSTPAATADGGLTPAGVEAAFRDMRETCTCSICHELFRQPRRLACGHVFCHVCIVEWMDVASTCPLCRARVRCELAPCVELEVWSSLVTRCAEVTPPDEQEAAAALRAATAEDAETVRQMRLGLGTVHKAQGCECAVVPSLSAGASVSSGLSADACICGKVSAQERVGTKRVAPADVSAAQRLRLQEEDRMNE